MATITESSNFVGCGKGPCDWKTLNAKVKIQIQASLLKPMTLWQYITKCLPSV